MTSSAYSSTFSGFPNKPPFSIWAKEYIHLKKSLNSSQDSIAHACIRFSIERAHIFSISCFRNINFVAKTGIIREKFHLGKVYDGSWRRSRWTLCQGVDVTAIYISVAEESRVLPLHLSSRDPIIPWLWRLLHFYPHKAISDMHSSVYGSVKVIKALWGDIFSLFKILIF